MIVQIIGSYDTQRDEFDLYIPGGSPGSNSCTKQWGSSVDLGSSNGGLAAACSGDLTCLKGKCNSTFGSVSSVLKAGCDWSADWYSAADSAKLVYKPVNCPAQLVAKTGVSVPAPGG
jgi:hypothetical protein